VLAQDIITKRSGERLQAKVLEIAPADIRYKRFESPEGPTYVLAKNEVLLIEYADSTSESFALEEAAKPAVPTQPAALTATDAVQNLYLKGQLDAQQFYQGYKGAGTGTLVTSIFSPLLGLIPAIACSSTTPKEHNLEYPDHQLMMKSDYNAGYRQRARKIKSGKVWKNWGIGFGVSIITYVLLAQ